VGFNGCAIVVSHDRYFLDRVVDKIFAFETGGNLRQHPGNYSVYLDFKKAEEDEQQQSAAPEKKTAKERKPANNSKPRRLSNWERQEFEQLEEKIAKLEAEKAEVEKILYNAPAGKVTQVQELYQQLSQLTGAIDTATERWMELAERDAAPSPTP